MDPTVVNQPAINEISDLQPVILPNPDLTLPDRVSNIEAELNINE